MITTTGPPYCLSVPKLKNGYLWSFRFSPRRFFSYPVVKRQHHRNRQPAKNPIIVIIADLNHFSTVKSPDSLVWVVAFLVPLPSLLEPIRRHARKLGKTFKVTPITPQPGNSLSQKQSRDLIMNSRFLTRMDCAVCFFTMMVSLAAEGAIGALCINFPRRKIPQLYSSCQLELSCSYHLLEYYSAHFYFSHHISHSLLAIRKISAAAANSTVPSDGLMLCASGKLEAMRLSPLILSYSWMFLHLPSESAAFLLWDDGYVCYGTARKMKFS